jgi:hypothetical protein
MHLPRRSFLQSAASAIPAVAFVDLLAQSPAPPSPAVTADFMSRYEMRWLGPSPFLKS